ncbi:GLPGLI family protein [Salegentibacter sp. UBA1130]|uniref:GLPGLI family protein n=1 Tax=Salegentibacter sp. UBA1130 TaxID=1947451 RepID=UPI002580B7A2|nr:GLPGLI family protein [Salegentibacter sp. UBA1130]
MQTFLLIIFSLIFSSAFAQNKEIEDQFKYKATYNLTWQIDSTDAKSIQNEAMVLFIGDKISRFSSEGQYIADSIKEAYKDRERTQQSFNEMRSKMPMSALNFYIFKRQNSAEVSFTEKIVKDNYRYKQEIADLNWEILPETKDVAGFGAQKAKTSFSGRNYTAWFTTAIPVSEGPYKFRGLPGLILEISDNKGYYTFKLTGFKELNDEISMEFNPENYLEVSREKFLQIKEEYAENPFVIMESSGITMGFQPGQKEKLLKEHREEFKKKNNPIELK